MEIETKIITDEDKSRCIEIEKSATPGLSYINDTWDMFTKEDNGEFFGALVDGELWGMGKFTYLYGKYAWLETLRVHKDYQRKGLGKAIYKRYMEQMKDLGFKGVGMYTEHYNMASKSLAEQNGFELKGEFGEYIKTPINGDKGSFKPIKTEDGEEIISKYYEDMEGFLPINRTFFPVNEGIGKFLASSNWGFIDDDNNIVIAGYRFQKEKGLHVPYFNGDNEKIMDFINYLANSYGSENIISFLKHDSDRVEILLDLGYKKTEKDVMTLWNYK